jgi:hypothetical protein
MTRELLITPAALIKSRRQRWLWADRIPLGTVTIFAGRGGEGKSTFALHVGAELINGNLEGDLHRQPHPFLIVSHEDDWATVMKPRLVGARANPEHVYRVAVRVVEDQITHETVPALPIDVDLIRQAVEETGARMIVVDPITSTINGDMHKVADVRRALDPLAALAQELEVAVVAIMHFNKGTGNVSDKLSGSHSFRDLARSVLLFATDDETGQRVVSVDKSNYSAERGSSFAFNLRSVDVETDDGERTTVAQVEYLGDTDLTVADIVNRGHDDEGAAEDRNAAQAFVVDFLKNSEAMEAGAGAVLKAARAAGFTDQEIKDARRRCKRPRIDSKKSSNFGAGWVWSVRVEGGNQGGEGGESTESAPFATFTPPSVADRLDHPLEMEVT